VTSAKLRCGSRPVRTRRRYVPHASPSEEDHSSHTGWQQAPRKYSPRTGPGHRSISRNNPAFAFACVHDETPGRAPIDGANRDYYWPVA